VKSATDHQWIATAARRLVIALVTAGLNMVIAGATADESPRLFFGIKVLEADSAVARRLGVATERGVLVAMVFSGSPAEQAGLKAGDVIVRFEGRDTPRIEDLQRQMGEAVLGASYMIDVFRGQQRMQRRVAPAPTPTPGNYPPTFDMGLLVVPTGTPEAVRFEVESPVGVVITRVTEGGPGDRAGLRAADLILELAGHSTETVEDYQAAALLCPLDSRQPLTFVRGQQRRTSVITVAATKRTDPPRYYSHPGDNFRLLLPPLWFAFPVEQPDVPLERQYTRIISPFAAYELKCFQGVWPAANEAEDLSSYIRKQLSEGPDRVSGKVELKDALCAWVSIPLEQGRVMYRVAIVHHQRRYVLNAIAPPLSDPEKLPLPIALILGQIQFRPSERSEPRPEGARSPVEDDPGTGTTSNPPTGSRPIPADWRPAQAGSIQFQLPPDWKASTYNNADEGQWFKGKELFPDASFSVHRDTTVEDARRGATLRERTEIRVGGQPATQYLVERTDSFAEKGMVVGVVDHTGTTVVFSAFAPAAKFEEVAPVLQQILDSVRIGVDRGSGSSSKAPRREKKRNPGDPQPPAAKPGVQS
jgi:hypothetical protein